MKPRVLQSCVLQRSCDTTTSSTTPLFNTHIAVASEPNESTGNIALVSERRTQRETLQDSTVLAVIGLRDLRRIKAHLIEIENHMLMNCTIGGSQRHLRDRSLFLLAA